MKNVSKISGIIVVVSFIFVIVAETLAPVFALILIISIGVWVLSQCAEGVEPVTEEEERKVKVKVGQVICWAVAVALGLFLLWHWGWFGAIVCTIAYAMWAEKPKR